MLCFGILCWVWALLDGIGAGLYIIYIGGPRCKLPGCKQWALLDYVGGCPHTCLWLPIGRWPCMSTDDGHTELDDYQLDSYVFSQLLEEQLLEE